MSLKKEKEIYSKDLVSFCREIDIRKGNLLRRTLILFLTSLTQEKVLCSRNLDSFFNKIYMRQGTLLQNQIMFSKRPWLPRGSHQMEEQHSGRDTYQKIQMKY